MVWYSHLLKNFPQFVVIHTVKGFSIVNEAEIDILLEFSCFFYDPTDVGSMISESSAFSKFSKLGFNSMCTMSFQMFKLDLEKVEGPEIKLPTSFGSQKKQEDSRKSLLLLH